MKFEYYCPFLLLVWSLGQPSIEPGSGAIVSVRLRVINLIEKCVHDGHNTNWPPPEGRKYGRNEGVEETSDYLPNKRGERFLLPPISLALSEMVSSPSLARSLYLAPQLHYEPYLSYRANSLFYFLSKCLAAAPRPLAELRLRSLPCA